jgi:hypothetical protein
VGDLGRRGERKKEKTNKELVEKHITTRLISFADYTALATHISLLGFLERKK